MSNRKVIGHIKMVNHLIKTIQETQIKDITIQAKDGKVCTTKLILASWSNFWKEILIDFDNSEDVLIWIDVDKVVLNKIYKFLTTGKVTISGPQENVKNPQVTFSGLGSLSYGVTSVATESSGSDSDISQDLCGWF